MSIYTSSIRWTGNLGQGNRTYKGYKRTWSVVTPGKPEIQCSNDPLLGGDPSLHNPEDMLISALASCHMLWYLHLAFDAGIEVHGYADAPEALGESDPSGAGRFLSATLKPVITVAKGTDLAQADAVHSKIHAVCYIARSVNFPVSYAARYVEQA